jgi:hypothetical protein
VTTSVRFGEVSLYCTWAPTAALESGSAMAPAAISLGAMGMSTADGANGGDMKGSSLDLTPSGRPYMVYAYPLSLALREAVWIAAKPVDHKGPFALKDISALVQRLLTGAARAIPAGTRVYYVLHLGDFAPAIRGVRDRSRNGGLVGPPAVDNQTYHALVAALDAAIATLHGRADASVAVTQVEAREGEAGDAARNRLYFDHYSPSAERRGYLVLDPRLSMVVDSGQEDVYVLLGLAQQAMLTMDGLSATSYATLVSRVIAWNANGDTQASLKDLERIEHSARTATVGAVAFSLSLALVSALLAVLLVQSLVPKQLAYPMGMFVLAALAYGLYAPTGWQWVSITGLMLVGIGLALTAAILLAPGFTSFLPLPA